MAETRENPARPLLSRLRGDGRPSEFRKWIASSWPTVAMLIFIFVIALFVRAYFGYSPAHDNGNLVSGGSDSYYWERIIHYSADTGKQLYFDPDLNFPSGIRNPRPPMFSMSVVVPSIILQNGFPSLDEALGWIFLWTPAFWGALTIVPTYLLGKETFGRRAGLVAAFFLAVMPSHVQRSVLSEADHDAFILFFIVLTFYLMLKAFKSQEQRKWVEDWRSLSSIRTGLSDYFKNNKRTVLYAAMAGVAYGSVIMAWVGFAYVTVLILAYYIVQVLFNKLRNQDSTSVTIVVFIAMAVGFALSFPVYYWQSLIPVRFDVPVYLWLASMVFGILFVVSRDYPWTITFPAIGILLAIGILIVNAIDPALAQAILTGQGYFVQNKLYSTIAEAKAPVFSELALGFGMVTFFMSLAGLIWAIIKIPKNTTAQYIFIVVWLGAAIFMAISAARFMFNAAPAFAIAAGWVLVMIVDRLDFNSFRKSITGASGSYLHVLRKSLKVRHVLGALFLAFMIVLPNVWYSVDAGIPSETKAALDKQIYKSLPSIFRPGGYDTVNGTTVWYLGAFGYSLPMPTTYFPAAWSWFSTQDENVTPDDAKPAFAAWWDYGFEAIEAGKHPTVADNFQNGYQITGNAIMAQSETDLISVFAYRIMQVAVARGGALESGVLNILDQYNVNSTNMHEILMGPAQPVINLVLSDPAVYGPMAKDTSEANARIVAARVELEKIGTDNLVNLYGALSDFTGWTIRYFMVDSRMFPSSATNTGIFYAPAKLSDRRIIGSDPIDFYEIQAILTTGQTVTLQNLTATDQIADYQIIYKPMFYNSMFYKAMVGYNGTDIGSSAGIPGLSSSLSSNNAAPGWNLTHFISVYRTAYFNPVSSTTDPAFRSSWRAVSLDDALALQQKIQAGEIAGYVDLSAASLYGAGASFLKYYKGAYANGTLTTDQGTPVAGITVTMLDRYGTPHGYTFTDDKGHYSLLAPPGEDTIVFSTGSLKNQQLIGSNSIAQLTFNVTDDQSMRVPQDLNNDGILDYIITKDYQMRGTQVTADIFWDLDGDRNYTAGTDELITGTETFATELLTKVGTRINSSSGSFDVTLAPGVYDFFTPINGINMSLAMNATITPGQTATLKLPVSPAIVNGTATDPAGSPVSDIPIRLFSLESSGFIYATQTNATGGFSFNRLVPGNYTMTTNASGKIIFNVIFYAKPGQTFQNATVFPSTEVKYQMVDHNGRGLSTATFVLSDNYDPNNILPGLTDEFGQMDLFIPKGSWTLYASYYTGTAYSAGMVDIEASLVNLTEGVLTLQPAYRVSGTVEFSTGGGISDIMVTFQASNGARVPFPTNVSGGLNVILPAGTYSVTGSKSQGAGVISTTLTLGPTVTSFRLKATLGVFYGGTLYMVKDAVLGRQASDIGSLGELRLTELSSGITQTYKADQSGKFTTLMPQDVPVAITLGNPGYSEFSKTITVTQGQLDVTLVASPDDVIMTGEVSNEGVGVRGVTVSFLPNSFLGTPVSAVTGANGVYSVAVPPASYTVEINQQTGPVDGQRYIFEQQLDISPSGEPSVLNIAPVVKVQIFGDILGGSTSSQIQLRGPEDLTINVTALNYSVFVLPGTYSAYVTSQISGLTFANTSKFDASFATREHDFGLTRARSLQGLITLGPSTTTKAVTVRAVSSTGALAQTLSSSLGAYSLSLPSGAYEVTYTLESTVSSGGRTLYVEWSSVQEVTIGTSNVILSPSLTQSLDNSTLTLKVTSPAGLPDSVTVHLIPNTVFGEEAFFTTAPTEEFSQSVQPGDYTVYATKMTDKTAAISRIVITRNIPASLDLPMKAASLVSGQAKVGGAGARVTLAISAGNAKLTVMTDPSGNFARLLPPGNFTFTSSSFRIERTLNVSYSLSTKVQVNSTDQFEQFDFVRATRRTVSSSWNSSQLQTALPGQKIQYSVSVTNTGNVADTYILTYTGGAKDFNVTFSASRIFLEFGTQNSATVVVTIIPGSNLTAGKTPVQLLFRSANLSSVRADLTLNVNVGIVKGVSVTSLGLTYPVSTRTTFTEFRVNNTGNTLDRFVLSIANENQLVSLGWSAVIIDPQTNQTVTTLPLLGLSSQTLAVKFTELRTDADPTAQASVFAFSENATGVSTYGNIPVISPDFVLGQGSLQVIRDDVAYEYDIGPLYTDIGLLAAVAGLAITFFLLRKRRGFGKQKGGAKK